MFDFQEEKVPTGTTDEVRRILADRRACLVSGPIGSGKSHAVREAVNGAVWVNLDSGRDQIPRFFVDLARQIDGGSAMLELVARQRLEEATQLANELLGARCLVVDRAERLVRNADPSWDDPLHALSAAQNAELTNWLRGRSHTPTVVVSRHDLSDWVGWDAQVVHQPPWPWPLKLQQASDGFRDWKQLTELIHLRPGGMTLARAVIPLTGSWEFRQLLEEGAKLEKEGGPRQVLQLLADTLAERAPLTWRRVFTLVGALDGAPCSVIESVLDDDDRPALASLRRIRLIEERDGRLTVLPVLRDFAGAALESSDCNGLLRKAADHLVSRVNDPASLDPVHADLVFRAHTLFVRGGDFINARRTATLHAAGLIELAKRTSLERDYIEARRLYGNILELLDDHVDSTAVYGKRTVSYVVHYRGFNDERSSDLHSPEALGDYRRSIELWPNNALWRQHEIEAFIARGDRRQAKERIDDAFAAIDDHPRRDTVLRARPARTAMRRDPVFALEIIDGIDIPFEQDPDGAELLAQIHGEWSRGVSLSALPRTHGELLFRRPVRVSAQQRGVGWRAKIHDFHSDIGRGDTALAALRNLADRLGDEAGALLSTPTHVLEDDQVARKSELIARIDPLNSDLGLRHATHRWLLGRIEDDSFVPLQRTDFHPISLPADVRGDHPAHGEYMAKVPVYRDGVPKGPVEQLRPAGSGRSLQELMATLTELRQEAGE